MPPAETTGHQTELLTKTGQVLLSNIAKKYGLGKDELLHRVLMQLAKFSNTELSERHLVSKEIERIARELKEAKKKYTSLFEPSEEVVSLEELSFGKVPKYLASIVHQEFHYIGYNRSKSTYLGLFVNSKKNHKRLVSIITLSPFDLEHVRPFLPKGLSSEHVLVMSRIFAFDFAPKNSISFMMGRTFRWIRRNKPQVKMLLTYLNPNVCFSGTSYKASNWILFGKESGLRYAYLDGEYITLRALKERFQTTDLNVLKRLLKERLTFSVHSLAPFRLYAYFLDRHLKTNYKGPSEFHKKPSIA